MPKNGMLYTDWGLRVIVVLSRRVDGYEALPGEDDELEDMQKKQNQFEEQCEKLLMEVYDSLYKVCLAILPERFNTSTLTRLHCILRD